MTEICKCGHSKDAHGSRPEDIRCGMVVQCAHMRTPEACPCRKFELQESQELQPPPMNHDPRCKPRDVCLQWVCEMCGERKSADDIEQKLSERYIAGLKRAAEISRDKACDKCCHSAIEAEIEKLEKEMP